jgi:hypothetical protein
MKENGMEAPETAPRRKRTSLLWIIPLLVVVAVAVDSALLMYRDAQVRASAQERLAAAPSGGGGCGGDCGSGGCGMPGAAKDAKGAKDTCPAHEAIAKKGAGAAKTEAGKCPVTGATSKPEAAKGATGGCPMHQAKAAGKCPEGEDCGKKPGEACAHGGDGSCPKDAAAAKPDAAKAAVGKCPAGADCGKKAGESCPHVGKGGCPAKQTAKPTAKPAAAEKATGAAYVCPMCPGVKSDKPGSCPKCGMALVKKP